MEIWPKGKFNLWNKAEFRTGMSQEKTVFRAPR